MGIRPQDFKAEIHLTQASHFTEGKVEAQRESLSVSLPELLHLGGKWLQDTLEAGHCAHWGWAGPQSFTYETAGALSPKAGKR